jgi:hypothetical protein
LLLREEGLARVQAGGEFESFALLFRDPWGREEAEQLQTLGIITDTMPYHVFRWKSSDNAGSDMAMTRGLVPRMHHSGCESNQ